MNIRFSQPIVALVVSLGIFAAAPAVAQSVGDYKGAIQNQVVPQVKGWVANGIVVSAIKAQNQAHASLSQSQIDDMDKQWRAETKSSSRPMVDEILANALSRHLGGLKQDGRGLYTEIFVMDNKGLNVGQSDMTSDYWQGDEAKWQKTYLQGPGAMLIDDVEFDESSQTFQSQVSLPVVDPASNEVIGAITVGVNVELLQ